MYKGAKDIFEGVVKGRNAFTPRALSWFKIKGGAIELSTVGSNIRRNITESKFMEDVYGVTVVEGGEYQSNKSKLFDTYSEAMEYINTFNPTQEQYYKRYNVYGDKKLVTTKL